MHAGSCNPAEQLEQPACCREYLLCYVCCVMLQQEQRHRQPAGHNCNSRHGQAGSRVVGALAGSWGCVYALSVLHTAHACKSTDCWSVLTACCCECASLLERLDGLLLRECAVLSRAEQLQLLLD